MNVCEFTLAILVFPPGQGQVPQDEEHEGCRDEFIRGLGHVSQSTMVTGSLPSYDVII
jgi:hypothetical protein